MASFRAQNPVFTTYTVETSTTVNVETTGATKFFVYAPGDAVVKVTKRGSATPCMDAVISSTADFGLEAPSVVRLMPDPRQGFTVVVKSGSRMAMWLGRGDRRGGGGQSAGRREDVGGHGNHQRLRRRRGVDNLRQLFERGNLP